MSDVTRILGAIELGASRRNVEVSFVLPIRRRRRGWYSKCAVDLAEVFIAHRMPSNAEDTVSERRIASGSSPQLCLDVRSNLMVRHLEKLT